MTDTPGSRGSAGGLPRGQVSEVVGPASSGRTSVAWAALAAATRRGESVALDRYLRSLRSADGARVRHSICRGCCGCAARPSRKPPVAIDPAWLPGVRAVNGPGTFVERVIDRAIKSLNLVVQSGVCTLVVIDLIDVPATALRRLPASTWFRIERAIEGSDTAVLILAAIAGGAQCRRPLDRDGDPGTAREAATRQDPSRRDLERRSRSHAPDCRRARASRD